MPVKRVAGTAVICRELILLGKRVERWNPEWDYSTPTDPHSEYSKIKDLMGEPVIFGGYWSIFAGSLNRNEAPLGCAVRELFEETKICAAPADLSLIKIIYNNLEGTDVEFSVYSYEVNDLIAPTLNMEHTEYGWFKMDALRYLPEKIDPELVKCVERYRRFRKSSR